MSTASVYYFEAREQIGGTWDLFRYPGICSDSDMTNFGYRFKPWCKANNLADAASNCTYLHKVVADLKEQIHFGHRVLAENYDSSTKQWAVQVKNSQQPIESWTANFMLSCTGYYS